MNLVATVTIADLTDALRRIAAETASSGINSAAKPAKPPKEKAK